MSKESQPAISADGFRCTFADNMAIRGARLIDPSIDMDQVADILIVDGKIAAIGNIPDNFDGDVIDGTGLVVCPGFFDMHVHLREPGFEHKETVASGCIAAVAGGFTGIAPMPNTNPPIDNPGVVNLIRNAAADYPVDVCPIATISADRSGDTLAEFAELNDAGVKAFSDDGSPVQSANLMRLALEYVKMFDSVIIEHCEEPSLTRTGVMDEGKISTELGLPGWPSAAEDIDSYRAIRLAEYVDSRIHLAHVSTAETVRLIRDAKERGVRVTGEATPHHMSLDSSVIIDYDTNCKVNPPLRTPADVEALIEGLADGTIDAIATDHAPHATDEKEVEFIHAPFGMIGLETALGVVITKLVQTDRISLIRAIDALSVAPRKIMSLPEIPIKVGADANLTLFDPNEKWTVDRDQMRSKSSNTPFNGWELSGRARGVINRGLAWMRTD